MDVFIKIPTHNQALMIKEISPSSKRMHRVQEQGGTIESTVLPKLQYTRNGASYIQCVENKFAVYTVLPYLVKLING